MRYLESFIVAFFIFFTMFFLTASHDEVTKSSIEISKIEETPVTIKNPPCIELHNSIQKYSKEYNVPINIAYGVAFTETRYKGPTHWSYSPGKTSTAGALGPMQVMYSTAKSLFPERSFSREELKNNIDFNVHCSMKLLKRLYSKYSNWKLVLGAYNTGSPCVNSYSEKVYNYQL